MAKDFAFPFYVNDWLGGTMYLTIEQKGAYLELLLLQFNRGSFTLTHVKQVLNTCPPTCWDAIRDKFVEEGGEFFNPRMREVMENRAKFVESRRNNRLGKVSPAETATEKITSVKQVLNKSKTYDKRMENENENENIKGKESEKKPTDPLDIAFEDFLTMRKKARKVATPRAIELIKNKLLTLSANDKALAIQILEQSTVNNWQDIYPLKTLTNGNKQPNPSNAKQNANDLLNFAQRAASAKNALDNQIG